MVGLWSEHNSHIAFLKFTTYKYAKKLIENGEIHFGTPKNWESIGDNETSNRGDVTEGALAISDPIITRHAFDYESDYGGDGKLYIINVHRDGYILQVLKNERHMNLLTYCFYVLKIPSDTGNTKEVKICGKLFNDFNSYKQDNSDNINEDDMPAVVVIYDTNEFIKRINAKLIEIGLGDNNIIFSYVHYCDLIDGNAPTKPILAELFIKDKKFEYQQEGRIVIDSDRKSVIGKIKENNNNINIGNISDIATLNNWYFPDGIKAIIEEKGIPSQSTQN